MKCPRLHRLHIMAGFSAIFISLIAGVVLYDWVVNDHQAADMERHLREEILHLSPPARAVLIRQDSSHKPRQALVGESYQSDLTYRELCVYYDGELVRGGWTFVEERPVKDWGRDFDGRTRRYRKDLFTAEFFYPGEASDSGYTYALDLSWGLNAP